MTKIPKIDANTAIIGAAVGAVAYLAYKLSGKSASDISRDVSQAATETAAGVVTGVVGGVVIGAGKTVGIPETDEKKCVACKKIGDVLGASAYCKAADFLKWLKDGMPSGGAGGSW